jgi:hypothetical protein
MSRSRSNANKLLAKTLVSEGIAEALKRATTRLTKKIRNSYKS